MTTSKASTVACRMLLLGALVLVVGSCTRRNIASVEKDPALAARIEHLVDAQATSIQQARSDIFNRCKPKEGPGWRVLTVDDIERLAAVADENVPATSRRLENFVALQPGTSRRDLYRRVGIPDAFTGSGIPYEVYVLEDCSEMWLATHRSGNTAVAWGLLWRNGVSATIIGGS